VGQVSGPLLGWFWGSFLGKHGIQKQITFLERVLEASGNSIVSLPGCFGVLLGGVVFQKQCMKLYKTHDFKNVCYRLLTYFGMFLETTSTHVGHWTPKLEPKCSNIACKKWYSFWLCVGQMLGQFGIHSGVNGK
jgi:hypothetical protein